MNHVKNVYRIGIDLVYTFTSNIEWTVVVASGAKASRLKRIECTSRKHAVIECT